MAKNKWEWGFRADFRRYEDLLIIWDIAANKSDFLMLQQVSYDYMRQNEEVIPSLIQVISPIGKNALEHWLDIKRHVRADNYRGKQYVDIIIARLEAEHEVHYYEDKFRSAAYGDPPKIARTLERKEKVVCRSR